MNTQYAVHDDNGVQWLYRTHEGDHEVPAVDEPLCPVEDALTALTEVVRLRGVVAELEARLAAPSICGILGMAGMAHACDEVRKMPQASLSEKMQVAIAAIGPREIG